jgi:hydrogenase maturation protease
MPDLRDALHRRLRGRTCLVGIGNPARGDDAVGVRLAEAMRESGYLDVVLAGTAPERWVPTLIDRGFGTLLLLDAVRIGRPPGTAVLLDAGQLAERYPQVSTHTLSLGTLARLIEASGCRVLLLGVEVEALDAVDLSPGVCVTLDLLQAVLTEVLMMDATAAGEPS